MQQEPLSVRANVGEGRGLKDAWSVAWSSRKSEADGRTTTFLSLRALPPDIVQPMFDVINWSVGYSGRKRLGRIGRQNWMAGRRDEVAESRLAHR